MFTLKGIFVFFCLVLIAATAVGSLVMTYSFALSASNKNSKNLVVALASKAKSDVQNFLAQPIRTVTGLQYVLQQNAHPLPVEEEGNGNLRWYESWWDQMSATMRSVDFLYSYVAVGFADGNYAVCKVTTTDTSYMCRAFLWKYRSTLGENLVVDRYYNKYNGAFLREENSTNTYDPRTRIWYTMVNSSIQIAVSPVYLSVYPTVPIIDVNAALFNASQNRIGTLSLTFELGTLSALITQLRTTVNTRTLLVDSDDLILASSYPVPFVNRTAVPSTFSGRVESGCVMSDVANGAESAVLCRYSLRSYPWPALHDMVTRHPKEVATGVDEPLHIKLDGETYYAFIERIETQITAGLNWRFLLLTPENDVKDDIATGRNIAIGIVVAFSAAAAVFGYTGVWITQRALNRFSSRENKTAALQDEKGYERKLPGRDESHVVCSEPPSTNRRR